MGLVANGIYGIKVFSGATALGSLPRNRKNFATNALTWENKGGNAASRERVGYPSGTARSAFHKPLKDGGARVTLTGGSTIVAGIQGPANMTATVTGGGHIVPPTLFRARSMQATITGGGNIVLAEIGAIANMRCVIRIGANPSAFDIAQAIWGSLAEQYDQAGTMGNKLNSAGAAGNPWTDTSDYPAGTKGGDVKLIKNLGLYVAGDK